MGRHKQPFRSAECHPNRKHHAKGLCKTCYYRSRLDNDPDYVEARKKRMLQWEIDNADKRYGYHLWRRYKITLEQYNEMFEVQGGVCAICKEPETVIRNGKVRPLAVDHDHETGAIRQLLCQQCNHMIGNARDNTFILSQAIAYLRRHDVNSLNGAPSPT